MKIEFKKYCLNIKYLFLLQPYKSSSSIHNIDTASSSKESKGKLTDVFKPSTLPK